MFENIKKFFSEWDAKVRHQVKGCDWVTQLNSNRKPFKRVCCYCGVREHKINGVWKPSGGVSKYSRKF